jgi:hypothetical protein
VEIIARRKPGTEELGPPQLEPAIFLSAVRLIATTACGPVRPAADPWDKPRKNKCSPALPQRDTYFPGYEAGVPGSSPERENRRNVLFLNPTGIQLCPVAVPPAPADVGTGPTLLLTLIYCH